MLCTKKNSINLLARQKLREPISCREIAAGIYFFNNTNMLNTVAIPMRCSCRNMNNDTACKLFVHPVSVNLQTVL